MNSRSFGALYVIVVVVLQWLAVPAPAEASSFRAYLSSKGSDLGPCTLAAPCRLLPAALAAVSDGGEIWMLDSANYNNATVTIAKSVSILAVPGALGSVLAINGPAISITTNGIAVALRNLVFAPIAGTASAGGVSMQAASSLVVEHCVFTGLAFDMVHAVGAGKVMVVDSVFRNPVGPAGYAVYAANGMRAQVANSRMLNVSGPHAASFGVATDTRVTVSDCIISGPTGASAYADTGGGHAVISVTRSTIGNATYALRADASGGGVAEVLIGASQVHASNFRWYVNGANANIASYGNNQFLDYSSSQGSLTAAILQ